MFRVIIAGGRNFTDYDYLVDSCEAILTPRVGPAIDCQFVSGGAKGADKLGERYVREVWTLRPKVFKPDYETHGRFLAPLRRNRQMAEYAAGGILIAFLAADVAYGERGGGSWMVKGGTSNMIMNAISHGMEIHTFRFK